MHAFCKEIDSDELEITTIEPSGPELDECLEFDPCRNHPNTQCKIFDDEAICECIEGYLKNEDTGDCTGESEHLIPHY